MLRGEWAAAVRLLMAPGVDDWPEVAEGRRRFLEGGDVQVGVGE